MTSPGVRPSVIICCYTLERLQDIREAVLSTLAQSVPPHQVIVAVDHNTALFQMLPQDLPAGVEVVLNDGARGVSETRNVGMRASSGDVVVYLDDDAVAQEGWLENLVQPFSDPTVAAVGGSAIPQWLVGKRPRWFPEELDWVVGCTFKGMPTNGNFVRNPIGCSMAFRKDILEQVGAWDIGLGGDGQSNKDGEETELSLRIANLIPGARIYYARNSIAFHKVPAWRTNLSWTVKRSFSMGASKAKVSGAGASQGVKDPLSRESAYLSYLCSVALPNRLRRFYSLSALLQTATMLLSIAVLGVGYLSVKMKDNKPKSPQWKTS